MDKGKMNDTATPAGRDPTIPTSGDPRKDQPLGGGTESGPSPQPGRKVQSGDRNDADPFENDGRDLNQPGEGESKP